MSKFFDELMESLQQMDEILRGERRPSRAFHVDALQVKGIPKAIGSDPGQLRSVDRRPTCRKIRPKSPHRHIPSEDAP